MIKKTVIGVVCALFLASGAQAQDALTNKDGKAILPESGEFGLGFNVVPLISFMGNNTNITEGNFVLGNNMIFGKYMLDGSTALRAHLGVSTSLDALRNKVFDDTQNSPDSLVQDVMRLADQSYTLGAGYEMRKGKGRVQGIFGADVMFGFSRSTTNYEYGNAFGMLNQAPTTTTNFFSGSSFPQGERTTLIERGNTFSVGLRPYVGVEYFIAPKLSIGAEFGLNTMYSITGEGRTVSEFFDPNTGENGLVRTTTNINAGRSGWNISTDNFNGAVVLMFYF